MDVARRFGLRTASALVVASMVGTGVFTTTGFLARDLRSAPAILVVWAAGGVLALFGALAYAELVVALPHNGGEYQLLRRLTHPAVGFVAGFASFVVGFCAPIAASSLLFAGYVARLAPVPERPLAVGLVAATTALHLGRVERGMRVHVLATAGKVALVAVMGAVGLAAGDLTGLGRGQAAVQDAVGSPAFAVGLVYVSYAYSGWNAAAYVAGEVEDPARNLPRALVLGTLAVAGLYLLLNAAYLASASLDTLAGTPEVAHAAARARFGERAGQAVSLVIAFGLLSTVSALVVTGPRVYEAMGHDHPRLAWVGVRNAAGAPAPALLVQAAVAMALVATSSVEWLIAYVGLTLTVFAALTVLGVFVLRARGLAPADRRLRTWGHPVTSLAFVALCAWTVAHTLVERPLTAAASAATVAAGLGAWRWAARS